MANTTNEKTTYRFSLGYLSQESIIKSKFRSNRYNISFNLNSQIKEWLKFNTTTNAFWTDREGPTGGQNALTGNNGIIYQFQRAAPTIPAYYSNGEYGVVDGAYENTRKLKPFLESKPEFLDSKTAYYQKNPPKSLDEAKKQKKSF